MSKVVGSAEAGPGCRGMISQSGPRLPELPGLWPALTNRRRNGGLSSLPISWMSPGALASLCEMGNIRPETPWPPACVSPVALLSYAHCAGQHFGKCIPGCCGAQRLPKQRFILKRSSQPEAGDANLNHQHRRALVAHAPSMPRNRSPGRRDAGRHRVGLR
jgi:hypothetical protein